MVVPALRVPRTSLSISIPPEYPVRWPMGPVQANRLAPQKEDSGHCFGRGAPEVLCTLTPAAGSAVQWPWAPAADFRSAGVQAQRTVGPTRCYGRAQPKVSSIFIQVDYSTVRRQPRSAAVHKWALASTREAAATAIPTHSSGTAQPPALWISIPPGSHHLTDRRRVVPTEMFRSDGTQTTGPAGGPFSGGVLLQAWWFCIRMGGGVTLWP